jgi:hypothetical protein
MQTEFSEEERRYECSVGSYLNPNADLSRESLAAEKGRIVYCPYFSKRFTVYGIRLLNIFQVLQQWFK